MPTVSQGSSAVVDIAIGSKLSVSTAGEAYVDIVAGPTGAGYTSKRITAATQTFGPYGVATRVNVRAVSGAASYDGATDIVSAQIAVDAYGNVQVAGPGGQPLVPTYNRGLKRLARQTGIELFGPSASGVTVTPAAGSGCTITKSGAVTVDGETWYNLAANATSATNNFVELTLGGIAPFSADSALLEFQGSMGIGTIITPYLGTAGFAQFVTSNFVEQAPTGKSERFNQARRAHYVNDTNWTKNGFTGTFASTTTREMVWTVCKVRIAIPNGMSCNLNFRSLRVGCRKGKGTICVVADDGYDSVYRYAAPLFESYGIPLTMAIIPPKVGTAGYMTEAQLQQLKARGHLCVAHGPLKNDTNLFDAPYVGTEDRLADITAARDWLVARGLTTPLGAKCYIWPEGKYATTAGEADLLQAVRDAGFTHGRSVAPQGGLYGGAISDRSALRLLWTTIGHAYAGATNTPDDANETTNIDAIVTSIQNLGTYGLDAHLMLHKFVPRGTATSGGIEIEMDRLKTILDAINTQVQAGKLEAITMDQLAF